MKDEEKKHRQIFFESMGEYLKAKRTDSEMSLREVADEVGCKAQFICNIERGKAFPPPHVLKGMIRTYKLPQTELMDFLMNGQRKFFQSLYFGSKKSTSKKKK